MKTILKSKFDHGKLIFLAPMEGITDHIYRDLAMKYTQMDIICTEFIRLSGNRFTPGQIKDEIKLYDNATLSVQLMGDDPSLFASTIPYIEEKGVKIIDLNLGCPSPRVNRKGCGVAMLTNLKLLQDVVSSMRKSINGTFSCKMRAGWENEDSALEITNILENEGVDFITVHPRTKMQRYKGHSNWDLIKDIKQTRSVPIIGNGDIFTSLDAEKMIAHTNCDGIMMGRGVLRDPFLINKINNHLSIDTERTKANEATAFDTQAYKQFYFEYIEKCREHDRHEGAILGKLKEHFSNFTKLLEDRETIWGTLKLTSSLDQFIGELDSINLVLK